MTSILQKKGIKIANEMISTTPLPFSHYLPYKAG